MLNYAINNETAERANSLPFLTFHPSNKEMSVMAENSIPYSRPFKKRLNIRILITPGDRFGSLTIVEETDPYFAPGGSGPRRRFKCLCDCGKTTISALNELRSGKAKSCGCSRVKGGHSKHPLYDILGRMKQTCTNPNNADYNDYGGRGITLCDEWVGDFDAFFNWAISNGWAKGLVIDREDNDKGYSPDNCRFVDCGVSSRNQRLKRKNNTSGYRGVYAIKGPNLRWISSIMFNNKKFYLGCFKDPIDAAKAYDAKAKELNGGYPLNFN
jgi:hypothetical protein